MSSILLSLIVGSPVLYLLGAVLTNKVWFVLFPSHYKIPDRDRWGAPITKTNKVLITWMSILWPFFALALILWMLGLLINVVFLKPLGKIWGVTSGVRTGGGALATSGFNLISDFIRPTSPKKEPAEL